MAIKLLIEPKLIFYEPHELEAWLNGDREGVSDAYLRRLARGSTGFGEYIVGRHFEKLGYRYIHHDFDLFGTNAENKYPKSEDVLQRIDRKKLNALRSLHHAFFPFRDEKRHPMETPDLLVYRPDHPELRFVECKREDTRDRVNHRQVVGLLAIATLLRCPVDVFIVRPSGGHKYVEPIEFTYGAAQPVIAGTCEDATLWVYDRGTSSEKAVITEKGTPPRLENARPLQALLAHLDLDEWEWKA